MVDGVALEGDHLAAESIESAAASDLYDNFTAGAASLEYRAPAPRSSVEYRRCRADSGSDLEAPDRCDLDSHYEPQTAAAEHGAAHPGGLTADSAAKFALEASGGAPNQVAPEEQAPAQWVHAVESQVWSACAFPSGRDVADCSRRLLLPLNLGPAAAIER